MQQPEVYPDTDSAPEPAAWPRDHPASGQGWKPEIKEVSLTGLDLLEGPPWSPKPMEAILVTVVHAIAPGIDEAGDP